MPQPNNLAQLLTQMDKSLDTEALRTLCFKLGVDFDNLGGEGKADKARELIFLLQRDGRLADLLPELQIAKPDVNWTLISAEIVPHTVEKHYIPFHPNELFTGREMWLARLHENLSGGGVHVLAGLGGVGKT